MLLVGIAGVVAVVVTIWIGRRDAAANGRDVRDAIGEMAAIANSMSAQRPYIERQANAAADSADAAKTTAGLAKGQTGAIIRQADALVGSAKATVVAAGAQLVSAQANTRTAEAGARAATEQLKSATLLAATRIPIAKLISVDLNNWMAASQNPTIKVLVKPNVSNAGGGTLLPTKSTFGILIAEFVPVTPPPTQRLFGFNEISVAPGAGYGPTKGFEYTFDKNDFDAVAAGKKGIIVWGRIEYVDTAGNRYQTCYLDSVSIPTNDDAGGAVTPIASRAYQCGSAQN